MKDCPPLDEFSRLLANPRDEVAWGELERHLASCQDCRHRLDTLTGAESILAGGASKWRSQAASSIALRKVIEQLQDSPAEGVAKTKSLGRTAPNLAFLQPTDEPGFLGQLGDYPVRRVIGQGGMGIVLEALDPVLKRTVAIKMLSPWAALDDDSKGRFLREAQSAAALTHENVVAIHAVDEAQGMPFLVLEYISGESLHERLQRQGKLPLGEVVRLGIEVARGLAAAHAKGLVHRDIKPANILLVEGTSRAKIADFGLAKGTSQDAITIAGTVLGTPEFMSPEQASGNEAGPSSDLFSLGAVLYVAATGVSAFRHESLLGTLEKVRLCQPRPLQEVDGSLPDWFRELIQRLLAKDPRQRPQSAGEVAEIMERQVASPPTTQAPASRIARPWWFIAPLALGAVALAITGGLWISQGTSKNLPPVKEQDPPKPQSGFTIAGRQATFPSLAAAVEAAREDDAIEVHGNGPYLTPPLKSEGKRLTIRAAANAQPVLIMENPGTSQPFLQTDSDLRLEGLEIRWTIVVPPGRSEAEILARCIVVSTHGRVLMSHCRIVSDRFNGCVGGSCREMILQRCHFVAKDGIGVFWGPEPGGRLDMEGCLLENRIGVSTLVTTSAAGDAPPQVRLARCTLATDRCLQLLLDAPPKQPLRFTVENTILDGEHLFLLFPQRPQRGAKSSFKLDDLPGVLKTSVSWGENGNLHRAGMKYVGRPASRTGSYISADLQGLDHWLAMWKLPPATSMSGEIRFQPRPASAPREPLVLDTAASIGNSAPAAVGAAPDKLGPGAAYRAWRGSPEYSAWPAAADK
ncbi:MAG: serine/threonine-protein kinase [Pirellulaceae bacterium]